MLIFYNYRYISLIYMALNGMINFIIYICVYIYNFLYYYHFYLTIYPDFNITLLFIIYNIYINDKSQKS